MPPEGGQAGSPCYGLARTPANERSALALRNDNARERGYRRSQMPADLVDATFGHCLAVSREAEAAEDAAKVALQRGGRSRLGVLAHARHESLIRATGSAPLAGDEAPADLLALAWLLAGTRPPVERAVVDLDTRHQLGRAELGRVLGLSASAAAGLATTYGESWDRELAPAVMAWLGPGDCPELATLLDDAGEPLAAAPVVAEHVEECPACGDRRRAMATVRSIVAQVPFPEAPSAVRAAAGGRRLLPTAPPPPIVPNRRYTWAVRAAAAVALLTLAGGALVALSRDGDGRDRRVDRLTAVGARALVVSDARVEVGRSFTVTNTSSRPVRWEAAASVPWLELSPAGGELAPQAAQQVRVQPTADAPEGEVDAVITITGADGSTVATAVVGTHDEAPQVGASVEGCVINAAVEDAGEVQSVLLHWRAATGGEATLPMAPTTTGWRAQFPPELGGGSFWVEAIDARGNRAGTAVHPLPAASCP